MAERFWIESFYTTNYFLHETLPWKRTHDISVMRCAIYRCATTAANSFSSFPIHGRVLQKIPKEWYISLDA